MLEDGLLKFFKIINKYGDEYDYSLINDHIFVKKNDELIFDIVYAKKTYFTYYVFNFKIYLPEQDVFLVSIQDDHEIELLTLIQTVLLGYNKILTPYQILTKKPNDIICFEKYDGVQSVHKHCTESTKFNEVFSGIRIFFDRKKLYNVSNKYFLIYEHAEKALTVQKNNLQNV